MKILYLMHVDWNWIKQRPHFVAEGLAENHSLIVVYPYRYQRKHLTRNFSDKIRRIPLFFIPYRSRNVLLYYLNLIIYKVIIQLLICLTKPQIIWVTAPSMFEYLPKNISNIIYDCMDDALGFDYINDRIQRQTQILEKGLAEKAKLIFVSSLYLKKVMEKRYSCSQKTVLVRNAFGGKIRHFDQTNSKDAGQEIIKLGYFGTVSTWFDYDSLKYCLDNIQNLEILVIGPVECAPKYTDKRLHFIGPIKHDELFHCIADCDCLIMPFKINELILSVDPVKLYEYINFNKPIIAPFYPEIQHFKDYVYFYSDKNELLKLILELKRTSFNKKYSDEARESFLLQNSWASRIESIKSNLIFLENNSP